MQTNPQSHVVQATGSPLSPHNKALYEAGKKMLIDSVDFGRSFCQFMISLSGTFIMVYIGILKFLGVETSHGVAPGAVYMIPPLLFLVSCALFIMGYFPRTGHYSLDILEEIQAARDDVIRIRGRFITIGVAFFLAAMLAAIILFSIAMGIAGT